MSDEGDIVRLIPSVARFLRFTIRRTPPMLAVAGTFILIAGERLGLKPQAINLFGVGLLAVGMMPILFDYLQGNYSPRRPDYGSRRNEELLERLSYELRNLRNGYSPELSNKIADDIAALRTAHEQDNARLFGFNEAERSKIMDAIHERIKSTLSDGFVKGLDERYGAAALQKSRYESIIRDFEALRQRLLEEVRALQRRANSNLAIGSITTLLAMGSLAFIVLRTTIDYHSAASVMSYYVPRITFVVFIEVFAFFFLRLYKLNLDDVKFYQNELTNVESKVIGLRAALVDDQKGGLTKIIGELAATERNFVLKKGETTVELERRKLDAAEGHAVLDEAAKVVERLKLKV